MSHYTARRDRKRLRAAAKLHEKELRYIRALAQQDIDAARSALARSRYDRPVRFECQKPIVYEGRPLMVPHVKLQMLAYRESIADERLLYARDQEGFLAIVEDIAAHRIAKMMVYSGAVNINAAKVAMEHPERRVQEYDFSVYVGRPVEVAES